MKKSLILISIFAFLAGNSKAQTINVTNTQDPNTLITNVLAGGGVTIFNVTYNGSAPNANVVQPNVGYFDANGTSFPLADGVIMSSGNVLEAANPATFFASTGLGGTPDADLTQLSGFGTFDANVIEFDFIPVGDSVSFNFVFASEEYPAYAPPNGGVNDVFGFFLSGPGIAGPYSNGAENIAILPGGAGDISINNINPVTNPQFYIDNGAGTELCYGGMSTVLSTILPTTLQCGQTYHFKIALSDAVDAIFDTAIFLEGASFISEGAEISIELVDENGNPLVGNSLIEGCTGAQITFINPPAYTDSNFVVNVITTGTATNGTDYTTVNPNYTIPAGQDSLTISIDAILDAVNDPNETLIIETYYISECGDTITISDTITIIDTAPSFNTLTTDIVIDCPTNSVPVMATTDGGVPNLIYDWGAQGTGQTVNVPGNINGTTTYNVTVTDACGIVSNGSVDVTLNAGPTPTINFNQNTFTICPGDNVFIDATVVNPYDVTQLAYNWTPTGDITEDITVSPSALTWYVLTVTDGCYTIMDSVKVDMGTVNLNSITVTPATDCPNQGTFVPGTLTVDPNALPLWNYTLVGGGNTIGPQANGNFGNLAGGITYFLTVVNDQGCTIDTAVFVPTTGAPMSATFVLDSLRDVDCAGDNNGGAYVDDITGGPGGPNYDVTWTHLGNGIHFQETVSGIPGDPDSDVDDLYGGTWSVVILDQAGCAWEEIFTINEPAPLIIDWVANDVVCFNDANGSVIVNPQGGNGNNTVSIYDDFIGGNQINTLGTSNANQLLTGWYYATVVDNKGCTVSDSVFIDEPGQFTANLQITDPLCYGVASGIAEITSGLNGQGAMNTWTYIWTPNPSGIPNGIGSSLINHLPSGQYTLTINDSAGCTYNESFVITDPAQMVFNDLDFVPSQCRLYSYQNGNGVVYASALGGTGALTYLWTNLGTGQTSTNSTWGGLNPGDYHISVQDGNGCFLVDTVKLDSVNPIASFDVTSAEFLTPGVCEGTAVVNVNFTNTSQNYIDTNDVNSVATFFWTMDSTNSQPWYLTHDYLEQMDTTYGNAGVYPVCLQVINDNGCEDVTCKDMIIYDALTFTPVNVFTPNGDGDNDVFTFANWAQGVATFQCTIVNRWGVQIYQMNDINDIWTGVNQAGNPVADGIYYYTYSGVATDGTAFSGQGFTYILGSGV